MSIKNALLAVLVMAVSLPFGSARAVEWVRDVEVTWIGTYSNTQKHFVAFSAVPQACRAESPSNPIMYFSEDHPGGKAMMASLMTALVSKRKVDYDATGCQIVELYLK